MDADATNQTTWAEVMQEHTDTVTDSTMQSTKRYRTQSQAGPHTSHLPSIRATEATQQSNPSTHNKTRCTNTGLSPRQIQNTTHTETDSTPGTQPPPASHRCPKRNTNSTPKESMDIPIIDLAPLDPHDSASSLWNYKKTTAARFNMATKLSVLCTNTKSFGIV